MSSLESVDTAKACKLLCGLSKAISMFYKGSDLQALHRHLGMMRQISSQSESSSRSLITHQLSQVKGFYYRNRLAIDGDRIIAALIEEEDFRIEADANSYIPIAEASIEACMKQSSSSNEVSQEIKDIEGYMYSIIQMCVPESLEIRGIMSKYKPAAIQSDASNMIDAVVSGILGNVSFNDPSTRASIENLGAMFSGGLKGIVDVTVDELEKSGTPIDIKGGSADISIPQIMNIMKGLMANPRVTKAVEKSINDVGGEQKIGAIITNITGGFAGPK